MLRERLEAERRACCFEVLPECWYAVAVFCAMSTQWRWISSADGSLFRCGLIYEALPVVLASLRGVQHRRPPDELLPQLQVMELAVMERGE